MVDRIEPGDEVQFGRYTGIPVRFTYYNGTPVSVSRYTGLMVKPTHYQGQEIIVTNPDDLPEWVRQKFPRSRRG